MGWVYWIANGGLPVIGALYGVETAAIGWITHLFHSIVFALLFVAAGLFMPVWLRAVGIPATLPNLPSIGLVGHGIWGITLGLGYVLLGGEFD